ncbi:surface_antigen-like_protein (plasmid) [Leishmania braziliensis MHOM/BR/75/M2904]|uniref:Surface_antigen-like_protein n=1 Tax=Leishmania braziliensis MHOM/BR/75/M2904 TaxID=420245 RepID=A0A3P3YXG7_LEIBR|nr:unnamed protein product [Leishmania braziliensis]CAJ2466657.1 unnamed protein product [Leishmania braziliensis]SYZ62590.1 surface_antigen-like_protein [Leishmania braziliensis MHOM/BR/75/M2904]
MPATSLCSSLHQRGVTAALLVLIVAAAAAVTASAQTIADYPPVPCDSTMMNCLECRNIGVLTFCSNCKEGYSTVVTSTSPAEFGKCRPYEPSTCALSNCLRCAADDNTKCIHCPVGYPSISTYLCEATTTTTTTSTTSTTTTPSATSTTTTPTPTSTTSTTTPSTTSTTTPSNNCKVPSCAACVPNNMYTCSVCEPDMVLMVSGQCMTPGSCNVANCAQCYPTDNNRCSSCNAGYALSASHACKPRQSGSVAAAPMSVMAALVMVTVAVAAAYVA